MVLDPANDAIDAVCVLACPAVASTAEPAGRAVDKEDAWDLHTAQAATLGVVTGELTGTRGCTLRMDPGAVLLFTLQIATGAESIGALESGHVAVGSGSLAGSLVLDPLICRALARGSCTDFLQITLRDGLPTDLPRSLELTVLTTPIVQIITDCGSFVLAGGSIATRVLCTILSRSTITLLPSLFDPVPTNIRFRVLKLPGPGRLKTLSRGRLDGTANRLDRTRREQLCRHRLGRVHNIPRSGITNRRRQWTAPNRSSRTRTSRQCTIMDRSKVMSNLMRNHHPLIRRNRRHRRSRRHFHLPLGRLFLCFRLTERLGPRNTDHRSRITLRHQMPQPSPILHTSLLPSPGREISQPLIDRITRRTFPIPCNFLSGCGWAPVSDNVELDNAQGDVEGAFVDRRGRVEVGKDLLPCADCSIVTPHICAIRRHSLLYRRRKNAFVNKQVLNA